MLLLCLSFSVSAETYSGEYEGFTWKCEDDVVTIEGNGLLTPFIFRQWIHPSENIDLNSEISRLRFCQLAAGVRMIVAQPPENPFTDTDDVMVLALYNAGVIGGTTETTFSPEKNLTRAQIAKIIYQLMKIK